ncbi:hypothetical protein KY333_03735 [Candidatus Woesearchaeota archaeon]|nr:hypothetical protein [Candidatus Woesearchaeota archaeon]
MKCIKKKKNWTIRNIDAATIHKFKITCMKQNKDLGNGLTRAMKDYIKKHNHK